MSHPERFDRRIEDIFREIEGSDSMLGLSRWEAYRSTPPLDLSVVRPNRTIETPVGVAGGREDLRFEDWLRFWYSGARTLEFDTGDAAGSIEPCGEEFAAAIALARRLHGVFLPDRELPTPPVQVQFRLVPRPPGAGSGRRSPPSMREQMAELRDQGQTWRELGLDCLVVQALPTRSAEQTETLVRILLKEMDVEVILELGPTLLGRDEVASVLSDLPDPVVLRPEAFDGAFGLSEAVGAIRRLGGYASRDAHRFSIRIGGTIETDRGPLRGRKLYLLGLRLLERVRSSIGPEVPVGFSADPEPEDVPRLAEAHVAPVLVRADLLGVDGAPRIAAALRGMEEEMRRRGVRTYPDYVLKAGEWGRDALNQALGEVSEAFRDARMDWPEDVREEVRRTTDEIGAELLANLDSDPVDLQRILREGIAQLRQALAQVDGLPVVEDHLHRLAGVRLRARDLAGALGTPDIVALARSHNR
ncbi:MAG: hypothetical protein AAB434_01905 [Planctomycetota bacterium]